MGIKWLRGKYNNWKGENMIPQIIYLILVVLSIGISMERHGEERRKITYNFWEDFISIVIMLSLLYWGGFLDKLLILF